MSPFSREPLKEFINRTTYTKPLQKRKKDSVEDIIFSLIVSVFLIGVVLFSGQEPTALVSFETNTDVININAVYNESTNLTFVLEGIPTSLRVTGSFIGNGTGIIFLDPFIAVEKDQLPVSSGLSITGFVVFVNASNESVIENITIELNETNLTSNITVNETFNITVNVTENFTIIPNITLNVSENITEINITEINVTQNITENVTVNETIIPNVTIEIEISEFDEYCLETCFLNDIPSVINLEITLNGTILNLSHITYTYEIIEEEIIVIPPIVNVTAINLTINETLNISINETNITLNITEFNITNVTFNITEFNITNLTGLNLTNVTIELNLTNITEINITIELNITPNISILNLTLVGQYRSRIENYGLDLIDYKLIDGKYVLYVGPDKNNFVEIPEENLVLNFNFSQSNDKRISSKMVSFNGGSPLKLTFYSENADVILNCVQFTEGTCKQWQKYFIQHEVINNSVKLTLNEPGLYAVGDINYNTKTYVSTNSVYYNSDCDKCAEKIKCAAENFCVMQNIKNGFSFNAQLDFDIFNIDNSWNKAEVCSFIYYNSNELTINYVRYSPESYCADIRQTN